MTSDLAGGRVLTLIVPPVVSVLLGAVIGAKIGSRRLGHTAPRLPEDTPRPDTGV